MAGIEAAAGPYHRFERGDVMAENILKWMPLLIPYWRDIAWAADCSERAVPLLDRQWAIETLFEAGREYRADYATVARILQGPPYTPPADQPD